MKKLHIILLITTILAFISCATVQETATIQVPAESKTAEPETAVEEEAAKQEDPKLLERIRSYFENGLQKLDQGVISEGISQLVSVLAETSELKKLSPELDGLVHDTVTELDKINAALSLDAGLEWIDENKNQISASSIDVGSNKGLNPSVMVAINFGAGQALVAGAPVFFEFVKGSGLLTSFVNTNEYGQATCSLARLKNPNDESIIRASLIYRVKGYSYCFAGIEKDFVFVPPARRATIVVMEKSVDTMSDDPVILDAVFNRLKGVTFDFSQYNGVLLGNKFMKVFGGDPQAIRQMGLEKEVSYLVMVLNDGYYVSQVELGGKKYNIFKSQTDATTRIIRVIDGKIMYSGTVQAVSGQGGTLQKAVLDGFRNAAEAMSAKLKQDLSQITRALSGTEE